MRVLHIETLHLRSLKIGLRRSVFNEARRKILWRGKKDYCIANRLRRHAGNQSPHEVRSKLNLFHRDELIRLMGLVNGAGPTNNG